ncbi:HEPN domain-containing protein [Photobacterium leiognathi]|uniref:HEPN domain-containing protein n=1 Tax=Photobacterium leiognathi TaxID=553611 RepID=UPI0029819D94|nr:HEPN domain-containing protein [Photobacterium leiognathi]
MLELSYDKSDFDEKNVSSSITDIINECLQYLELEEKGVYEASNTELDSLFEEIKERIREDIVAKNMLGDKIDYYLNLLNSKTERKSLKNILEIINLKINPIVYFDKIKDEVRKYVYDYTKKDDLIITTTMFFNFLVSYGYQKSTIYFLVNRHFFDKSGLNKITDLTSLDDFYKLFDLQNKKFEVVFSASKIYSNISDSCEKMGLKVVDSKKPLYGSSIEKKFYRHSERKVYIICENVDALDYQHAMKVAEERVSLISDLFVVFYHNKKPWFSDYCLVYKHDKSHVVSLHKSSNIMTALSENDLNYVEQIFPVFLSNFGLTSDSFHRFHRGVELHAHALETDEVASQILNLWICLEALLITEKSKSHIATVASSVELIVSAYIIRRKISSLRKNIIKWNKDKYEIAKSKLPVNIQDNNDLVIAALVGVVEFKDIAGELLAEMNEQPLLRYKFMKLVRELQTRKSIISIIDNYKTKCQRDIRRVYRSRNKIVHQGNINDHNDYIAEMAHYYLDIVLFAIIERRISFNDINSIDNLIQEMKITIECHKSYLKENKSDKLNVTDFKRVLFGPES